MNRRIVEELNKDAIENFGHTDRKYFQNPITVDRRVIIEVIEILSHSKQSFKSKQIEKARHMLEGVLTP